MSSNISRSATDRGRTLKASDTGAAAQQNPGGNNVNNAALPSSSVTLAPSPHPSRSRSYPTQTPTFTWNVHNTAVKNAPMHAAVISSAPAAAVDNKNQGYIENGTMQTQNQGLSKGIWISSLSVSIAAILITIITVSVFCVWRRRRAMYWRELESIKADFSNHQSKLPSEVDTNTININSIEYPDVSPDIELQSRTDSFTFSVYWESKGNIVDENSSDTNQDDELESSPQKQDSCPSLDFWKSTQPTSVDGDEDNEQGETFTDHWESSTIASLDGFSLVECTKK